MYANNEYHNKSVLLALSTKITDAHPGSKELRP